MKQKDIEYLRTYKDILTSTTGIPIYTQLEYVLGNMIDEYLLIEGDEFFSEEEIADTLGISRPTVNKAMTSLLEKGYILRGRGKRAVVCNPNKLPLLYIDEQISIGEMLECRNIKYHTQLLKRQLVIGEADLCKRLELATGSELVYLQRLRSINSEPAIIIDSWCDSKRFGWLMEIPEKDYEVRFHKLIEDKLGIKITSTVRDINAARMNAQDAVLLNASLWEPCMLMTSVNYDQNNKPVELFRSRLKGNHCVLHYALSSPRTN